MAWIKSRFWLFLFVFLLIGGGYFATTWWLDRNRPTGTYHKMALLIDQEAQESCDLSSRERRIALSKLMDRYRSRVLRLWEKRDGTAFPEFKMESVGPIFIRAAKQKDAAEEFDQSVWSWEESSGIFHRTQQKADDPSVKQHWLDLDTSIRYLLEKDFLRIVQKKTFLEPEKTEHTFRRISAVKRRNARTLEVQLDPGEFRGSEKKLEAIITKAWNVDGNKVVIRWQAGEGAYRVLPNFQSARSFVNHRQREMRIANFAFDRTVAHEFGHVLGFDDHYYSVWNPTHCYYTQKSRLSDLMSNSESGFVQRQHWGILARAYPWKDSVDRESFPYIFQKE
jgi:hypothetical protein